MKIKCCQYVAILIKFFTIYKDQNFYYDQSNSGYVTPEAIKNKVLNNPMGKNNCSKATNNGLL